MPTGNILAKDCIHLFSFGKNGGCHPMKKKTTDESTNKQTKQTNKQASYPLEYATIEDTIRHNIAQMPSKSKAFISCLLTTIIK